MKNTTTSQPARLDLHRVPVDFLPHVGWQAEVDRGSALRAGTPDSARDKRRVTGYKRARVGYRLPHEVVPVELVIGVEREMADSRQTICRVTPKSPNK